MTLPIALAALLLVGLVVAIVLAPLRAHEAGAGESEAEDGAARAGEGEGLGELEAEREAKYQEIRDAELDYRTGKLSQEDYEAVDRALRAEAIVILDRIEAAGGEAGRQGPPQSGESED